jgi:PP-loop superfamily ATP-utilizing enzyme
MSEFSTSPLEKARKAQAPIFHVLKSDGKQGQIATALGVSDSTMSRLVNDHMEAVIAILYHAGFQVVSQDLQLYPSRDVEAWYSVYRRQVMQSETAADMCEGCE